MKTIKILQTCEDAHAEPVAIAGGKTQMKHKVTLFRAGQVAQVPDRQAENLVRLNLAEFIDAAPEGG